MRQVYRRMSGAVPIKMLFVFTALLLSAAAEAQGTECRAETLEIREKADDGSVLRLEFGSLWAIDRSDWARTRVWLRLERVHVCAEGLRKQGASYVVTARRIE
jgi:hypothetical protein